MKNKILTAKETAANKVRAVLTRKHKGIDGILVTVGLCIIALVLCFLLKEQLSDFITSIVGSMKTKALGILGS